MENRAEQDWASRSARRLPPHMAEQSNLSRPSEQVPQSPSQFAAILSEEYGLPAGEDLAFRLEIVVEIMDGLINRAFLDDPIYDVPSEQLDRPLQLAMGLSAAGVVAFGLFLGPVLTAAAFGQHALSH